MKSMQIILITLLTIVPIFMDSCGKKKEKDEGSGNGDLALTGPAAFVGNWSGLYRARNGESKPEGESRPVEAQFLEDGNFTISLTDDTTALAKGVWQEFGGKSIILTVKSSSISRIGGNKPVIDASYELTGTSVHIQNEDFELKIRKSVASAGASGSATTASGITGKWVCSGNGKNTILMIAQDLNWRATITSEGHSTLIASGSGVGSEGIYTLSVKSSQPAVKDGSTFIFKMEGTQANLSTLTTSGEKDLLGTCHRE